MKICGIYCITNTVNSKKYIGQSVNMSQRLWIHRNKLKRNVHFNPYLQQSYNKHGDSAFDYSMICTCSPEELDEKEIYYINLYNSQKAGYNRASGGKTDYAIREDGQKKKASKAQSAYAKILAKETHKQRFSQKGVCKECGAETKNRFNFYCEKHTRKCTKCGKRFPKYKGYTYCEQCGNRTTMFDCLKCGQPFTKSSNSQKFCKDCERQATLDRQKYWMRAKRAKM